jgi:hypothetical protein
MRRANTARRGANFRPSSPVVVMTPAGSPENRRPRPAEELLRTFARGGVRGGPLRA